MRAILFQLQGLKLLQTILPNGLQDTSMFSIVIEKLFHLLGNIAVDCYPDVYLYNFGQFCFSYFVVTCFIEIHIIDCIHHSTVLIHD